MKSSLWACLQSLKGRKRQEVKGRNQIKYIFNCKWIVIFFSSFLFLAVYYRSLQSILILYRSIRFNIVTSIMEIRVIAINIQKKPFPVLSLFLYSCTRINLGGAWFQNNKQIRLNDKSSAFSTDFNPASRAKSKSPIGKHFGEKQVCIFLSLKHDYCKHCFPTICNLWPSPKIHSKHQVSRIQNQIPCSIKKYVQAENLQAFRRQNSNKNESNKHAITLIICSNAKADCNIIGFWLGIICWSILL